MTPVSLSVENLVVEFGKGRSLADVVTGMPARRVRAVDDVTFAVPRGRTLGLVGESGSGKSTVARAILGLNKPLAGRVLFEGQVLGDDAVVRAAFRRDVQLVFQDPYSSLNPRMTVGGAVAEVLRFHRIVPERQISAEVERLFGLVGLSSSMTVRTPRELSGGQRQRVGLARALAVRPRLLVLDEPVAALDVSIQAQVLNLLVDLRDQLGLTMLFVAHELGVVRHMSDWIAVLYLGRIMEIGPAEAVFRHPRHPYTQALLDAVPRMGAGKRHRTAAMQGDIPSPMSIPKGCRFKTRCPRAQPVCDAEPPEVDLGDDHRSRCHFAASL